MPDTILRPSGPLEKWGHAWIALTNCHAGFASGSILIYTLIRNYRTLGMYVCICKSVSNHEIKDAVERGDVTSLSCLRKCLGVGTGCGICLESAKECLSDALARNLPCDAMAQYESLAEIRITAALV